MEASKTMLKDFRSFANGHFSKSALSDDCSEASFDALATHAEEWAHWLRMLAEGRPLRVASLLPGGIQFTALQIGCLKAECTFVPIPETAKGEELRHYVSIADPHLIVASKDSAKGIEDRSGVICLPTAWDDLPLDAVSYAGLRKTQREKAWGTGVAQIQFTSGSTGFPKAILLSRENLEANLESNAAWLSQFQGEDVFSPMPQYHAMGGSLVLEFLSVGCGVHLSRDGLFADHLKRIREREVTVVAGPPSYFRMLAKLGALSAQRMPSVKTLILGSDACDQMLYKTLRTCLPSVTISLRYGLSEAVGPLARLDLGSGDSYETAGAVGKLVPGCELRPSSQDSEDHEISVRGRNVAQRAMLDNSSDPQSLTDVEGYLSTGDMGRVEEDGQLIITGRQSQFIKRNGYRIGPTPLEEVLRLHQEIDDAVVVGLPDPWMGQALGVLVESSSLRPPESIVGELRRLVKEHLSASYAPREIRHVPGLPRLPSGKPNRALIQQDFFSFPHLQ